MNVLGEVEADGEAARIGLGALSGMAGRPVEFEKRADTGVDSRMIWGAVVNDLAPGADLNVPVSMIPLACAGRYPGWGPKDLVKLLKPDRQQVRQFVRPGEGAFEFSVSAWMQFNGIDLSVGGLFGTGTQMQTLGHQEDSRELGFLPTSVCGESNRAPAGWPTLLRAGGRRGRCGP